MESHSDNRSEGRSNVFLTAALETGAGSAPVRIRNLSSVGALVDGTALPPVGAKVSLLRGHLRASGEIVWQEKTNCGIRFDHAINVMDWVQRPGHSGQQRVDGIVSAIRNSNPVPRELQQPVEADESLAAISRELDQICERLARAPSMSIELGEELLRLDALGESLRKLAAGRSSQGS
ncbi:MAG TPA: PilZ domain-containing protein [Sphingomicrobium sp.]|nr:PilZ domain-containing protein [Sphingomicrobium sp.]